MTTAPNQHPRNRRARTAVGLFTVLGALIGSLVLTISPANAQPVDISTPPVFIVPDTVQTQNTYGRVAVSGTTIVTGNQEYSDTEGTRRGAAYVLDKQPDGTFSSTRLLASDGSTADFFGATVDISGNTIVAGAEGAPGKGAVYVFGRTGNTWTETQRLSGPDTFQFSRGGISLADDVLVIADENYIRVNQPAESGHVYYALRDTNGQYSTPTRLPIPTTGAAFGFGAQVAATGNHIFVVADAADVNGTGVTNAVYVYTRTGNTYTHTQTLAPQPTSGLNPSWEALDTNDGRVTLTGRTGPTNNFARYAIELAQDTNGTWQQTWYPVTFPTNENVGGIRAVATGTDNLLVLRAGGNDSTLRRYQRTSSGLNLLATAPTTAFAVRLDASADVVAVTGPRVNNIAGVYAWTTAAEPTTTTTTAAPTTTTAAPTTTTTTAPTTTTTVAPTTTAAPTTTTTVAPTTTTTVAPTTTTTTGPPVVPQADLVLTTSTPVIEQAGGTVATLRLTVTNNGPATTGGYVTGISDGGFSSPAVNGASCSNPCALPAIPAGGHANIEATALTSDTTDTTFTITVHGTAQDPNSSNNTVTIRHLGHPSGPQPTTTVLDVDPVLLRLLPLKGGALANGAGATLRTASGHPLPGATITFTLKNGTVLCAAETNLLGYARCTTGNLGLALLLNLAYQAHYTGNTHYTPATGNGGLIK